MNWKCKNCNGTNLVICTKDNGSVFNVCVQCGTATKEEYMSAKDYFNKFMMQKTTDNNDLSQR